tara:strand:- start:1045 stop:1392 length:348 start_codon:yes stop_codon:yes gene_type:complete
VKSRFNFLSVINIIQNKASHTKPLVLLLLLSKTAFSKILIVYPEKRLNEINVMKEIIEDKIGIPQKMIQFKEAEQCKDNSDYDMVICLNKKNGELTFPTYNGDLIAKKYNYFLNN